eukprot:936216-Pleurochrysis_carterae.AAC.1
MSDGRFIAPTLKAGQGTEHHDFLQANQSPRLAPRRYLQFRSCIPHTFVVHDISQPARSARLPQSKYRLR